VSRIDHVAGVCYLRRPTAMTETRNVRRWTAVCTFVAALWLLPATCSAQTATRKWLRGLAGMAAGVLELPGNIVAETRAKGPAEGIPLGFAKGLGMIVVRELVGVYEFLSAPFAAPAGYRPIIEPEFPWSYFEESPPPRRRTTRRSTSPP
jgi:putative exosortase-associated protein (TIGR04073 family)